MNQFRLLSLVCSLALIAAALGAFPVQAFPSAVEAGSRAGAPHAPAAPAAYASGWLAIAPGATLTLDHNVGGDPGLYAVDLWFRDTDSGNLGVNQAGYGGEDESGQRVGAYWKNLTSTQIRITRMPNDTVADQVLVRVRQAEAPDWDSGWLPIQPGDANSLQLTHNLGGDAGDYLVGIKFRDTSKDPSEEGFGVHHYTYGGVEYQGEFFGAVWHHLNASHITVTRFANDQAVNEIRVMIYLPDPENPPAYDSGWQTVSVGQLRQFQHALGGNPSSYIVRFGYRSADFGPNIFGAGSLELSTNGQRRGLHWERLTSDLISVYRQAQDPYGQQVRIRIWAAAPKIFLPLVIK